MTKRLTTEEFIRRARAIHGDKYDYSQTVYKSNNEKVLIGCAIHGLFEQRPAVHLLGYGCKKCGVIAQKAKLSHTTEDFVRKAKAVHGDRYDYSKVDYRRDGDEVEIICKEHGSFMQRAGFHIAGHGCPKCNASSREKDIMAYLDSHGITYQYNQPIDGCELNGHPLFFDFVITGRNIVIEHQGQQHFKEGATGYFKKDASVRQQRDQIKREYCREHGIRLIEIRYDEDIAQRLSKELSV